MAEIVVVQPAVVADPNATPKPGISGDGHRVVVDPAQIVPKTPDPVPPVRPDGLPEKFKTVADLVKAHAELEIKLGAPKTPASEGLPKVLTPEEAKAAVVSAGLDMTKLAQEFVDTGALSQESLKVLEAKGISRATVDTYIAGQRAIAEQMTNAVAEAAGGKEGLDALYKWATTNLSAEEINAYNAVVETGNIAGAKLAIAGLVARHQAAEGVEPSLVKGEGAASRGDVQPFESRAQIVKAMGDKRYANDPAYRAKVEARMNVTDYNKVQ